MKNTIKLLIIMLVVFFITGCYRAENTITINSDRSVDVDVKILVGDNFNETPYLNNIDKYDVRGLKIQRITESGIKGFRVTKKYNNLDELSIEDDVKVDISKYFESDFDETTFFKVDKGFFKNVYTAYFTVDTKEVVRQLTNKANVQSDDEFLEIVKDIYNNALNEYKNSKVEKTYTDEKNELKIDKDVKYQIVINKNGNVTNLDASNKLYKYSKEKSKIEKSDLVVSDVLKTEENKSQDKVDTSAVKFVVKLPHASVSNNAKETSGSGETLTWVFDPNGTNEIIFSFELSNSENYVIIIGFGSLLLLLIVIMIVLAIKLRDRKRSKIENVPIYKSEEEPVTMVSNDTEIQNIDEPNIQNSEEAVEIKEEKEVPEVINIE